MTMTWTVVMKKIFLLLVLTILGLELSGPMLAMAQSKEKSIIEYLGTTYIMPDGCPTPNCDTQDPECIRTKRAIRNLYTHCVQSEEGQHVGCITDKMGDGSYLTVPVYATMCSAMCYESKRNMARVKKCPYPGFRKHDPSLSKLFK